MKRWLLIVSLAMGVSVNADDDINDVYYTPELATRKAMEQTILTPKYPKNIKEIIFIDDSINTQPLDTLLIENTRPE